MCSAFSFMYLLSCLVVEVTVSGSSGHLALGAEVKGTETPCCPTAGPGLTTRQGLSTGPGDEHRRVNDMVRWRGGRGIYGVLQRTGNVHPPSLRPPAKEHVRGPNWAASTLCLGHSLWGRELLCGLWRCCMRVNEAVGHGHSLFSNADLVTYRVTFWKHAPSHPSRTPPGSSSSDIYGLTYLIFTALYCSLVVPTWPP